MSNPLTPPTGGAQSPFFSSFAGMVPVGTGQPLPTGTDDVFGQGFNAKHQVNFGAKGSAIGKCWRIRILSFLNNPYPFRRTLDSRKIAILNKDRTKFNEIPIFLPPVGTAEYQEALSISDHQGIPIGQRASVSVDRLLVWAYEEGTKQADGYVLVTGLINAFKWIEFKPSLAKTLREQAAKDPNNKFKDEVYVDHDNTLKQWLHMPLGTDTIPMYDLLLNVVASQSPSIPRSYSLDPITSPITAPPPGQAWGRDARHPHVDIWLSQLFESETIRLFDLFDRETGGGALTPLGQEIVTEMETFDTELSGIRRRLGYKDGQFDMSGGLHYGDAEAAPAGAAQPAPTFGAPVMQPQQFQPQVQQAPQQFQPQVQQAPQQFQPQPQQVQQFQPQPQQVQQAPQQFQPQLQQVQQAPQQFQPQQAPQPQMAVAPAPPAPSRAPQPATAPAAPPIPQVESPEGYEQMPSEASTATPRFQVNPHG